MVLRLAWSQNNDRVLSYKNKPRTLKKQICETYQKILNFQIVFMKIYHHTKSENLEKIIKKEGLFFRGSYYEEFSDADYKWTKRVVFRIIKRICVNRVANYDEESSFKPIIISFGKEANSLYMWKRYTKQYTGIQLILDSNIIQRYAYNKLDYFSICKYMHKRGRMKRFIERFSYNIESINDIQSNLEAISALIKPTRFRKEQELRYIHAYSKLFNFNYEDYLKEGDKAFKECVPEGDEKERFFCFPKDALIGIRIGYRSSYTLDEVKSILIKNGYDISQVYVEIYNP